MSRRNPITDGELIQLQRFAHELSDEAGRRLLKWFGKTAAGVKQDGSFVTEADLEVDRYLHDAIQHRYPAHGIVSEETSCVYHGARYTWVLDPLDGTTNYANGLHHWGSSIALLREGEPLLGVLDFPLLGQRFSAVAGGGARLNARQLRVSPPSEVHGNHLFTLDSRGYRYLDIRIRPKPRILGSAAYDLAAVAAGVAVACIETTPKIWDLAAAWLVVQEAGGAIAPLVEGVAVFPLADATDYTDRVFPLLAAADGGLWRTVRGSTRIKPGAEYLLDRLHAQGWRLEFA